MSENFATWSRHGSGTLLDVLAQREQLLGAATLSSTSLHLLYDITKQFVDDLPTRIYWHGATRSAAETQAVLPPDVFVQKTVSVEMAGKLLLWTSVGEQEQDQEQRRTVAALLGLLGKRLIPTFISVDPVLKKYVVHRL